jgi:hypothetical protein
MKILERFLKVREYDKKTMVLAKVLDYDNQYVYTDENGKIVKHIPTMWIIEKVYEDNSMINGGI